MVPVSRFRRSGISRRTTVPINCVTVPCLVPSEMESSCTAAAAEFLLSRVRQEETGAQLLLCSADFWLLAFFPTIPYR